MQNGAVEFHTWGATVPDIAHPDRITMDLDPGPGHRPGRSWCEATRLTRTLLEKLGLQVASSRPPAARGCTWSRRSSRSSSWDEVKEFTRLMAEFLVQGRARLFIAKISKAKRTGKIFVDYLRNAETASAVAAYSRARAQGRRRLDAARLGRARRDGPARSLHGADGAEAAGEADAGPVGGVRLAPRQSHHRRDVEATRRWRRLRLMTLTSPSLSM